MAAQIVPKHLFASPADIEAARQLISAHVTRKV
jgi:hypothetical protein